MPWVQLDDQYPEHPKIDGLSDGAFRLHTSAIVYCGRHLTDGIVPAEKVARLVPRFKKAYLTELVERLLWHDLGNGTAYAIHDFLDWNRSREQVERDRHANVVNGRKGAAKRWAKQ